MGKNGKGSGLRQRQKTSGAFLKGPASFWRTASSFSERTRTSGPERKGYTTYVSGEFRAHPEAPLKTPATEFCKTAATATTLSAETTTDRAFQGVVAPPFFRWQKGLLPPLSPVFYPGTTGGGGKNRRRRRTKHREKETGTDRQNYGCIQTKTRLQSVKTTVTIQCVFLYPWLTLKNH